MVPDHFKSILKEVSEGSVSVEDAFDQLKRFPVDTVTEGGKIVARLDTHRRKRQGFSEVILAEGKAYSHLEQIIERALTHKDNLLVTRLTPKRGNRLKKKFPALTYAEHGRCLYRQVREETPEGMVAVLTAGTSDISVAEEAAITARLMGANVVTHYDAGVAGLHRLLAAEEMLTKAQVFIVVAGMEGALPSVVGGLVNKPVIAVPTSQGYGAGFNGLSALLGMLNSCASNVTTVNIDNGFGAGYVGALINRIGQK